MKVAILWMGLLCLSLNPIFAQNDGDLAPLIQEVFSDLDKSSMQTDFLMDQGYHIIRPDQFYEDSNFDPIPVNHDLGELMYAGLLTAAENNISYLPDIDLFSQILQSYADQDMLAFAIVYMQMDALSDVAANNGDLYKVGQKIYAQVNLQTSPITSRIMNIQR